MNAPVCDVGLNETEHLLGRPGDSDKDTVVDLEETEELEDFAGFRGDLADTVGGGDRISFCTRQTES